MYLILPSSSLYTNNVESSEKLGKNSLTAATVADPTPYNPFTTALATVGNAATVAPKEANLFNPCALSTGFFASFIPKCIIFPAVLTISAGKDIKLPKGNLLNACTNSPT